MRPNYNSDTLWPSYGKRGVTTGIGPIRNGPNHEGVLKNLKSAMKRVARVHKNFVLAGHARPTRNAGHDGLMIAKCNGVFDAAIKDAANIAFMTKSIANF